MKQNRRKKIIIGWLEKENLERGRQEVSQRAVKGRMGVAVRPLKRKRKEAVREHQTEVGKSSHIPSTFFVVSQGVKKSTC